jgi:uncharacterized protein (DUF697 family)
VNTPSIKADQLIKQYSFRSSLTGFIPIPLLDTLGLLGVQQLMLYHLSVLYDVPYSKSRAKTRIAGLTSGLAARVASPMVGSALKLIPGIGTLVGGASMAMLGGASTYAVGKVFQQHFEEGGTLENFDPKVAKETFETEFKVGKKLSRSQDKHTGNEG